MSVRGIRFRYFAMAIAVIAIIAGVCLTFFRSKGFEKTMATITSITERPRGEHRQVPSRGGYRGA
ncbi:MAG: hypothetical protein IKG85_02570 [Clostridia bacterium]|nr:hypothetical protein [Clostridia bacterium]